MVTRQINECDHFRGTLTNLLCCPRLAVIHNLGKEVMISGVSLSKLHKEKSNSTNIILSFIFESIGQTRYQLVTFLEDAVV